MLTEDDGILGYIISSYWYSRYDSIENVKVAIERAIGILYEEGSSIRLSPEEYNVYVLKYREFLT